jgi:hypothetical protein
MREEDADQRDVVCILRPHQRRLAHQSPIVHARTRATLGDGMLGEAVHGRGRGRSAAAHTPPSSSATVLGVAASDDAARPR